MKTENILQENIHAMRAVTLFAGELGTISKYSSRSSRGITLGLRPIFGDYLEKGHDKILYNPTVQPPPPRLKGVGYKPFYLLTKILFWL